MNKELVLKMLHDYLVAEDKQDTTTATELMSAIRAEMHKSNPWIEVWEEQMSNSVVLTKELNETMHPTNRVYSPNSLPLFSHDLNEMTWSNSDEQYVIKLDLKTNLITGHFYDWDEEAQDWTDKHDVQMSSDQIMEIIKRDHLLMIRGRQEIIMVLKIITLTIAIWFTTVNIAKIYRGHNVPSMNFLIMAGTIAGFIYSMGWLN